MSTKALFSTSVKTPFLPRFFVKQRHFKGRKKAALFERCQTLQAVFVLLIFFF
jgi:hypothetical protein